MKNYISDEYETVIPDKFDETLNTVDSTESETDDDQEETLYYNDNQDYGYTRFKNENNKPEYKCLRCDYVFNRADSLHNHYNRKIKCYEDPKIQKIEAIKKQNNSPIILKVDDNTEYTYYEKYNREKKCIEYYCNRCNYMTTNLNVLKKHYLKREIKCYEENKLEDGEKREHIYTNDLEYECKYYECKKDNQTIYSCNYCNYTTTQKNYKNMMRHFDKKKKCYHKDYEELFEQDDIKFYVICKDNVKSFRCYYCQYESGNRQHLIRHFSNSKNNCYLSNSLK
jgi:hypothetical protein